LFHIYSTEKIFTTERIDILNKKAEENIETRGYDPESQVPSDLSNPKWFLPINVITSPYCPTWRYDYLKYKGVRLKKTWESYQGKIIDELFEDLHRICYHYLKETKLGNLDLPKEIYSKIDNYLEEKKNKALKLEFIKNPNKKVLNSFFTKVKELAIYEATWFSSIINYSISNNLDINIEAEFLQLFPFNFKYKVHAEALGFSGSPEIDFIYKNNIIGEVKSLSWHDLFNLTLAAYALVYEEYKNENVNLGIVLCPLFDRNRRVPIYNRKTEFEIISEDWRKAVIQLRNKKIESIKKGEGPPIPADKHYCSGCGYNYYCLGGDEISK